jgi:hypothetical protein
VDLGVQRELLLASRRHRYQRILQRTAVDIVWLTLTGSETGVSRRHRLSRLLLGGIMAALSADRLLYYSPAVEVVLCRCCFLIATWAGAGCLRRDRVLSSRLAAG